MISNLLGALGALLVLVCIAAKGDVVWAAGAAGVMLGAVGWVNR